MRSARLSLRAPRTMDASAIASIANDTDLVRWLERVPFPYYRHHADEFIQHVTANWHRGQACHFVIQRLEDKKVIGMIGLDHDAKQPGEWALGYWLGKDFWGQGYTTEAVEILMRQLLPRPAFKRIRAMVHPDNIASGQVLGKAGFQSPDTTHRCFFPHIRDWAFCPVWYKDL